MHMIAIGWLWVAFMMAITEKSVVSGVLTFAFYGLFPCGVLLYLLNKQAGKRRAHLAQRQAREREAAQPNTAPESTTQPPPGETPGT